MSAAETTQPPASSPPRSSEPGGLVVPLPALVLFRGIGQIVFQESALTGLLFALGIALSSPTMALAIIAGAAIGSGLAWILKFDKSEVNAGIYGFNSALVGIATVFFFEVGVVTVVLLVVGCSVAALVTYAMRRHLPFPTYTTPFIVTTWAVYLIAPSVGAAPAGPGYGPLVPVLSTTLAIESTAHGIGQIMFQASLWTGILFLTGIAVSNREHASLVLFGSIVGGIVAGYHVETAQRAIDPEQLVERDRFENIRLGLYGYNATLAPVALFLWRRSLTLAFLGMLLSVPLTETLPRLGIPALTAPFVLATWLVMLLVHLETRLFTNRPPPSS
jgi:urea transporter